MAKIPYAAATFEDRKRITLFICSNHSLQVAVEGTNLMTGSEAHMPHFGQV
jgi:hypothetical protein